MKIYMPNISWLVFSAQKYIQIEFLNLIGVFIKVIKEVLEIIIVCELRWPGILTLRCSMEFLTVLDRRALLSHSKNTCINMACSSFAIEKIYLLLHGL